MHTHKDKADKRFNELSQTMSVTRVLEMHRSYKGGRVAMKPEEWPSKATIYCKKYLGYLYGGHRDTAGLC